MVGEHKEIFRCVASIYKFAMAAHGLTTPIPIILLENRTKVKACITWDPK
jgi:hypothetical protein